MALINCAECGSEVSDTALRCPHCSYQLKKAKRGVFGKIFKYLFIIFNLLMGVWLFSYFGSIGEISGSAASEAEKAGTAIGATIGTSMILGFWVFGDVIIGLLVLFTRPKA